MTYLDAQLWITLAATLVGFVFGYATRASISRARRKRRRMR